MYAQKMYSEQFPGKRKFKEVEDCIFVGISDKRDLFVCHDITPTEEEQDAQLHNVPMLYLENPEGVARNVVIDRVFGKKEMLKIISGYTYE